MTVYLLCFSNIPLFFFCNNKLWGQSRACTLFIVVVLLKGPGWPDRCPPGHVRPVESLVNRTVMLGMLEILHKYNNLSNGDSLPTATTSLGSLAETPILSDCVTYGLPAVSTIIHSSNYNPIFGVLTGIFSSVVEFNNSFKLVRRFTKRVCETQTKYFNFFLESLHVLSVF